MQTQEPNPDATTNEIERKSSEKKCSGIGIYGLRNKINGKWYVGQTINEIEDRWNDYRALRCVDQPKIYRALLKYGYENFDKVVLENCKADKKVLNERETFWIRKCDSIKNGYNVREGGTGGKMTEETRRKMSIAHMGKRFTQEHRNKLSEAAKKRPKFFHTQETVEKMKLRKGINAKEKNGNFGKFWITNGVESKMIKGDIPIGWYKGHSHHKHLVKA